MTTETSLAKYGLESSKVLNKVKVCLWNGDGNIAKSFGIDQKLKDIDKVTANFDKLF